jgi:hypothetical protein
MVGESGEGPVIDIAEDQYTVKVKTDWEIKEEPGEERNRQIASAVLKIHDPQTKNETRKGIVDQLKQAEVNDNWIDPQTEYDQSMISMMIDSLPHLQDISQLSSGKSPDNQNEAGRLITKARDSVSEFLGMIKFDFSPNSYQPSKQVFNSKVILELKRNWKKVRRQLKNIERNKKNQKAQNELLGPLLDKILQNL